MVKEGLECHTASDDNGPINFRASEIGDTDVVECEVRAGSFGDEVPEANGGY